jgi:hypothetical protein
MFKLTEALYKIDDLKKPTEADKFLMRIFAAMAANAHKEDYILWKKPPIEWTLDDIIHYVASPPTYQGK